jgi:TRAP-type C4-dicarboxylate transport system permease small subunit
MKVLNKVVELSLKGGMWLAISSIFVMTIILVANIISRKLGYVINITYEVTQLLSCIAITFCFAITQSKDGHISVNLISSKLSKKAGLVLKSISSLFSIVFLSLIIWANIDLIQEKWSTGEFSQMHFPLLPFRCVFVFGLILFCLTIFTVTMAKIMQEFAKK